MKIAICDDDKKICTQIENTLLEYAEKSMQNVEVLVFFSGEDLIEYMNKGNLFQLIYLDIEMKKMNGVDVGKYIRKILKDYATEIVYISGHNGYDRQLFDVQPLHFIEKPILSDIVIQDFELALERIGKKTLYFHLKYQSEFGIVIMRIICYAFVRFLSGFKNIRNHTSLPLAYWLSLFVIPSGTILMLYPLFMSYNISRLWAIIGLTCALIINVMTFYLYDKISELMQEKLDRCVQQDQNHFYENQVEIMVDALEKIKMIRHDLKNKLSPIYDLAKTSNNNELISQISSLMEFYPSNKIYAQSGNIAVDSILNYKLYEANKQNIQVSTEIFIPKDLSLPSFDIAAILGNLLDNAKEAAIKTNNAWIECKIRFDRGRLFIEITNSYNGKLCKQKEKFLSIKSNKENHGYGIKSIENTLKRYNGEIEFWNDDNKFTAKVMLYV